MKYGLLMHKTTCNIGDDIQSYASQQFLPQIDYLVDRENMNSFKTEDDTPVATVMSAWYMWEKWNWPPARCIYPKFVGMHFSDHQISKQPGSPIKLEFLDGIGKDYLNAYGPIGVRDMSTLKSFKNVGIDAYYSGCITLTLPQMKKIKPKKEYICVVDVAEPVLKKIKKELEGTDIELKLITHRINYRDYDVSWEDRQKKVEELLTIYQNAKCVVTRRLHCALPCIAMGVPVLTIISRSPSAANRFEPYYDYLHNSTVEDYVEGRFEYDITNPPANNGKHIPVREKMIADIKEFIEETKTINATASELCKTTYTDDEVMRWQNEKMREALHLWLLQTRALDKEHKKVVKERNKLKSEKESLKKSKNSKENKEMLEKYKKLEERVETFERCKKSRIIRSAIRFRNAFRANKIDID